jgi:hypothetical protein
MEPLILGRISGIFMNHLRAKALVGAPPPDIFGQMKL